MLSLRACGYSWSGHAVLIRVGTRLVLTCVEIVHDGNLADLRPSMSILIGLSDRDASSLNEVLWYDTVGFMVADTSRYALHPRGL